VFHNHLERNKEIGLYKKEHVFIRYDNSQNLFLKAQDNVESMNNGKFATYCSLQAHLLSIYYLQATVRRAGLVGFFKQSLVIPSVSVYGISKVTNIYFSCINSFTVKFVENLLTTSMNSGVFYLQKYAFNC